MADNAEELERQIDTQLDTLDSQWADGPQPGEQPEGFLAGLVGAAEDLLSTVKRLTPEDIDDIFVDADDEEGDEV